MKLIKTLKFTIFIIFIVAILAFVGAGYLFWKNISETNIKNTNLNITDIVDESQLKTISYSVDYFFTTGNFAEIVSYDVQAGFDLNEMHIDKRLVDNNTEYIVTLGKPKILNIDQSDKGLVISDGSGDKELIHAFKIYGENYAKHIALQNNILIKANKYAKEVFNDLSTMIGAKIEVNVPEVEEYNEQDVYDIYYSKRQPLAVKFNKNDLIYYDTNKHLTPYVFYFKDNEEKDNIILLYPFSTYVGKDKYEDGKFLFSPVNKGVDLYFDSINKNSSPNYALLKIGVEDKLYNIEVQTLNSSELYNFLPKALDFIYNIFYDKDYENSYKKHDYFGVTLEEWNSAPISEIRYYLNEQIYAYNINRKGGFMLKTIYYDNIPIVTDSQGMSDYNNNQREFTHKMERFIESISRCAGLLQNDIAMIIYDYNYLHRDRAVFFTKDKLFFFTPERKNLFSKQDEVCLSINYYDFGNLSKYTKNDGVYCFGDKEKCLDEDPFSYYLDWLKDKGFISFL